MKKENKLILRAMKAALKAAEVAERIRVKNDTTAEPPKKQGCEYVGSLTSRLLVSRAVEIKRLEEENTTLRKLLVESRDREDALRLGLGRARKSGRWEPEDRPQPDSPSTEKVVEDFAGDDTPHVEKLLEPLGDTPRALVHVKSPELGTETLVVLSPEGETLLKIVKDNSRKFEVR